MIQSYYFTLNRSNQAKDGSCESESHFEGVVNYCVDKDTQMEVIGVDAYLTGFTQYVDGKPRLQWSGGRVPAKNIVLDWDDFERECTERAFYEAELKIAA